MPSIGDKPKLLNYSAFGFAVQSACPRVKRVERKPATVRGRMDTQICGRNARAPGRCRSWLARSLALLLGMLVPLAAHAGPRVEDIRIAPHEDGARVVIDLNQRVSFRHLTLSQPPRLAIDLPDVAWVVPQGIGEQPVDFIEGYRFGRFRPGVSRLVVDLAGPFEIRRIFELPANGVHGHRIVTEVAAASGNASPTQTATAASAPSSRDAPGGPPDTASGAGGPAQSAVFVPSSLEGEGDERAAADGLRHNAALPVPLRRPPPERSSAVATAEPTIVIDPGHGGIDPGAIGVSGKLEKNIVLAIAKELRRQLEQTGRYEVVMTREGDEFVRLRDRLRIAREHHGDLFLSLHADSLVQARNVRGAAIYTLSERASNDEAARLASKENRADILGGVDLSEQEDIVTQILIDLAQRDANNKSIRVAELLAEELGEVSKMLRRQRQQAGFVVLKSPDMPSALVELGYLSNPVDERLLSDPEHVADLAGAIVRAVDRFFGFEAF